MPTVNLEPTHRPVSGCCAFSSSGTWTDINVLNSLLWLGTRRCSSSWAMTKSWNPGFPVGQIYS